MFFSNLQHPYFTHCSLHFGIHCCWMPRRGLWEGNNLNVWEKPVLWVATCGILFILRQNVHGFNLCCFRGWQGDRKMMCLRILGPKSQWTYRDEVGPSSLDGNQAVSSPSRNFALETRCRRAAVCSPGFYFKPYNPVQSRVSGLVKNSLGELVASSTTGGRYDWWERA